MAEQTTSQTQQIKDNFRKAVSDHAERVESVFTEMAKLEEKGLEQAAAQLDEAARLTKVSLAYGSELAAQWRKLWVDAARRTAEMVSGPGARLNGARRAHPEGRPLARRVRRALPLPPACRREAGGAACPSSSSPR